MCRLSSSCFCFSPFPESLSWGTRFSSLPKNQHPQIQFDQDRGPAWKPADVTSSQSIIFVFIYFFIFFLEILSYSNESYWRAKSYVLENQSAFKANFVTKANPVVLTRTKGGKTCNQYRVTRAGKHVNSGKRGNKRQPLIWARKMLPLASEREKSSR